MTVGLGAGLSWTQSLSDPVSFPLVAPSSLSSLESSPFPGEGHRDKCSQKVVLGTGRGICTSAHVPLARTRSLGGLHPTAKEAGQSVLLGAQEDGGNGLVNN